MNQRSELNLEYEIAVIKNYADHYDFKDFAFC